MTEEEVISVAQPTIGLEERQAVDRVLTSGLFAQGPEVFAFESEFSEHFKLGRPSVAVNSGTSGLHLGLLAAGIGSGDEVIVPSFTFAATANAVALTGATPVFADIEPDFFTLDPESVRASVTPNTRAIIPVHLFGHPYRVDEITSIARQFDLLIFEDAAQAHGASWRGQPVGTFGSFAVFSFYPTKNMTAGEGGMVVCVDEPLARSVRLLRNQGMETQYENEVIGFNARMTDIHAAIGRVQLKKINRWTAIRQFNAKYYDDALRELQQIRTPKVAPGAEHVYHQYTIRVDANKRDAIRATLKSEHGVGTGVYYPTPSHRLRSLAQYAKGADLPETDRAAQEVLSLPVHPSLSEAQLDRVVDGVREVISAIH